jgi:hypothetical protein
MRRVALLVLLVVTPGCCGLTSSPLGLGFRRLPRPLTVCADGLAARLLLDPSCYPDGVCGYSCLPNRWKE